MGWGMMGGKGSAEHSQSMDGVNGEDDDRVPEAVTEPRGPRGPWDDESSEPEAAAL